MNRRLMAIASLVLLAVLLVGTFGYLGSQNRVETEADMIVPMPPAGGDAHSGRGSLNTGTYDYDPYLSGPSAPKAAPGTGSGPETESLVPPMEAPGGIAAAAPTSTVGSSDVPVPGAESSSGLNSGTPYQQQYQSNLTAGQEDDNAKFSDYLDYLRSYYGDGVTPIDVSQRLYVRVLDGSQQPVAGARVQLYDSGKEVFDGSTMSDGRVLFFPSAAGETQATQFNAVISRGQTSVQSTIKAGGPEQVVTLGGLKDNSGPVAIDLVFLLDATGSMDDEIEKIKESVGSIAERIEQLPGSSAPRFGLVAFRDRGDDFVTRSWDFTSNIGEFSNNLSSVYAGGGGDTPESVNAGLHDAIHLPGWADNSTGRHLRMIVLVGDAPPHIDYQDDYRYPELLQEAAADGIKIFPVGASDIDTAGEYVFRQFAEMTQGQFVFLTYANGVSGAPGVSTDMHVPSGFTVQNLDMLIVNLVAGEVANQTGQQSGVVDPQPVKVQAPIEIEDVAAPIVPAKTGLAAMLDDFVAGRGGIFWAAMLVLVGAVVLSTRKQVIARVAPAQAQSQEIYVPDGSTEAESVDEETSIAAHLQPGTSAVQVYLDVMPSGQPTVPLR